MHCGKLILLSILLAPLDQRDSYSGNQLPQEFVFGKGKVAVAADHIRKGEGVAGQGKLQGSRNDGTQPVVGTPVGKQVPQAEKNGRVLVVPASAHLAQGEIAPHPINIRVGKMIARVPWLVQHRIARHKGGFTSIKFEAV